MCYLYKPLELAPAEDFPTRDEIELDERGVRDIINLLGIVPADERKEDS